MSTWRRVAAWAREDWARTHTPDRTPRTPRPVHGPTLPERNRAREFHDRYGHYPTGDSMDTFTMLAHWLTVAFCGFILAIMAAVGVIAVVAILSAGFVDGHADDVPLKCTESWLATHNGVC